MATLKNVNNPEDEDHIFVTLKLSPVEYSSLEGHVNNLHVVALNTVNIRSSIFQRGRMGNSKYALIPKVARKGVRFKDIATCQMTQKGDKAIFVYLLDLV